MQAVEPQTVRFEVARVWVAWPGTPRQVMIRIGPLVGSHGWIAQRLGYRWVGCWIADDERAACHAVELWMRRRGGVDAWRELKRPEPREG